MKLHELLQLPIRERLRLVSQLKEAHTVFPPDVQVVSDILTATINWFPPEERAMLVNIHKENNCELSAKFDRIYDIQEESIRKTLSANEQLRIFNEYKEAWCYLYPDFKRLSDIMERYRTNELLVEYGKKTPPPSIHDKAIEVYKKCISFKVKLTKKVLSPLKAHPDQLDMWHHYVEYCINPVMVKAFLKQYQRWNLSVCNLWNDHYYVTQDFFHNSGYKLHWRFYKEARDLFKGKADETQAAQDKLISLLTAGKELVSRCDEEITLEYEDNATEMSLHERELEILQISEDESGANEEYCYVYTLECALFVFYVGIAADPKERFEQHLRGAFSDEAHLFKSKFIQKYHHEVKQNIIFEGTRRECRRVEKDYISQFSPLGNMTVGGEG